MVLSGSGRMKLDDEIIEIERLADSRRARGDPRLRGRHGRLEVLAVGAHHDATARSFPAGGRLIAHRLRGDDQSRDRV